MPIWYVRTPIDPRWTALEGNPEVFRLQWPDHQLHRFPVIRGDGVEDVVILADCTIKQPESVEGFVAWLLRRPPA